MMSINENNPEPISHRLESGSERFMSAKMDSEKGVKACVNSTESGQGPMTSHSGDINN